jgi:hypothetical protein
MDRVALTSSKTPGCATDARREDLVYLDDMLVELRLIARRQRLDMLVYLIDMAHFEASDQIRHILRPSGAGRL